MIISCYVRKPALTPLLLTLDTFEAAAVAISEEIVLRRFADNPADAWTTEVRDWVPADLNVTIQSATDAEVSTLIFNGDPVAVALSEVDDIFLDAVLQYLARRGITGTISMLAGASSAIKADVDAAPHTEPL